MLIDLHVHTDASDGTDSVEQVMQSARDSGLDVIGITDHDNTVNWESASELALELGIGLVPGMEMTTRTHTTSPTGQRIKFGTHLLSYLHDPNHTEMLEVLERARSGRIDRLMEMTDLIAGEWEVSWDEVLQHAENAKTLGRPSLADALVTRGHFESRDEVFNEVWGSRSGFYVPNRKVPDTLEAIALIRRAGGVPVIAHPLARSKFRQPGDAFPRENFKRMVEAGLMGIEVFHREIDEPDRKLLLDFAQEFDLIVTGSSDYHGELGKKNRLGENTTSPEMLRRIIDGATGHRPVNLPKEI